MKHGPNCIALLAALVAQQAAHAADRPEAVVAPTVLARAIGNTPNAATVSYVARNAAPTVIDPRQRPDLGKTTILQITELRCGSVQDAYLAELSRANGGRLIQLEDRIGEFDAALKLPACLYASSKDRKFETYTVKSGDTLTGIHKLFTGSGTPPARSLSAFFATSGVELSDARNIRPGQLLTIPSATAATVLTPTAKPEYFVAGLAAVAGSSVVAESAPKSIGEIIGPVRFSSADLAPGAIQSSFAGCERGDGSRRYPLDGESISAAYAATRSRLGAAANPVSVVVVDNGFFGIPCGAIGCPDYLPDGSLRFSDRFPRSFFDTETFASWNGLGPALLGTEVGPLNYFNYIEPGKRFLATNVNDESGHGTHVAGLALGGPGFVSFRDIYRTPGNKTWLTLVIANLAGGKTYLSSASVRNLAALLAQVEGYRTVNMSIAFNGQADASIAGTLADTLKNDSRTLVVAAAGNSGSDLQGDSQDYYPARFGGDQSGNILTVASIDGPIAGIERLSNFSNRGSKFVDLAAPGCGLESWLDAERDPVAVSGTSQAAPMVTFAASLLQSLWKTSPAKLKNRLLYSGELLSNPMDRSAIRSMAKLDTASALMFPWDSITYRRDGLSHTLFGELSLLQDMSCDGLGAVSGQNIRSVKRSEEGRLAIYRADSNNRLDICWGAGPDDLLLRIAPQLQLLAGAPSGVSPDVETIRLSEVTEIIRAR